MSISDFSGKTIAIDFETANGSPASPCAVGLVRVRDGKIAESVATLIQPPYPNNWFHEGNIRVHGIRPSDVDGAPEMHEALAFILAFVAVQRRGLEAFVLQ